eukprot:COSAG06_NODE_3681_length_5018_cov_3.091648_4_plen_34_part_00
MAGQEGSRWAAERVHNEKYVQYSNQRRGGRESY